jgi:hypothetical protein
MARHKKKKILKLHGVLPLSGRRNATGSLGHVVHGVLPRVKGGSPRLHLVPRVVLLGEAVWVAPHEHVAVAVRGLVPHLVPRHHAWVVARDAVGYAVGLAWIHVCIEPHPPSR